MAETWAEAEASARQLRTQLGSPALSVPLARLYSQRVQIRNREAGLETWDQAEYEDRLLDAVRLVDAALIGRAHSDSSSLALRRAGEILEWLAEPGLSKRELPLETLSAACYQLAGYPARAAGVMSGSDSEVQDSLMGLLLAGDFANLLASAAEVAVRSRRHLRRALRGNGGEAPEAWAIPEFVTAEVASALGIICAELRWGSGERTERAVYKLEGMGGVLRGLRDPYTWLLIRLTGELASQVLEDSLRVQVSRLIEAEAGGQEVLERYVRLAFVDGRVVAWPSQIRGLDRLALGDSFALCTPTGSGKTTVAEVALLDGLFREVPEGWIDFTTDVTAPLCLYIVPSRALAAEIEGKLSRVLRRAGGSRAVTITGLYGGTDWGPTDVWLTNEDPTVLICTQEKAEALVRFFGKEFVGRLRLVIVDEAHNVQSGDSDAALVTGESRALRLESLVSRLRLNLASHDARFIALSAVAQHIEQPLSQWISGDSGADPATSDYRSTRQLVGRLLCQQNGRFRIEFDRLDGSPIDLGSSDDSPYIPNPFPPHPQVSGMDGPSKGLAPYALWAAVHLAAPSGGRDRAVLISIAQQPRNFANWCIELLEDQWKDIDLPDFFSRPTNDSDSALWEQALNACADFFGVESREYRLLSRGIVVHHGKMPGRLPRLLVQLIERRIARIAIATSTLSQGVNLPFETVLIPGLRRFDGGPLTGREFGNLVGRVGRPGVATEGQALVLLPQSGITSWQRQAARRDYDSVIRAWTSPEDEEAAPSSALAELIEALWEAFPGDDADDFYRWLEETAPLEMEGDAVDDAVKALDVLDAQILAATTEVEEFGLTLQGLDLEERLRSIWRETFAHYAAAEEERLEEIFVRRGSVLESSIYPEERRRRRYYRTSLGPRDAEQLYELVPRFEEHISSGEGYADWQTPERLAFVLTAISLTAELDRFELREEIGRSKVPWREVMHWWLSPDTADREPTESQVTDWLTFADKDVSYRFNWAVGALLAVLTDESSDGEETWGSPEAWEETGLPFIAVWIKDLIVWGTLDPVAAYLLARGGAVVRADAEDLASGYYEDHRRGDHQSDILDPQAVRQWVTEEMPKRDLAERPPRAPQRIQARLLRRFRSSSQREWRVLPLERKDRLLWVDPGGFPLARSDRPNEWDADLLQTNDFFLVPRRRQVISRLFL